MLSVAVMGFRHAHIYDLIERIETHPHLNLVAVCEEDEATRTQVEERNLCEKVFASYAEMLDSVSCDVIGVGDFYGKRGAIIIEALRRGKHVLSDKPICTSLEELNEIEKLVSQSNLSVGCQFDIRDNGSFRALRQVVAKGVLGDVRAVHFGGQHPLMRGSRAGWYFEKGMHGGTINDIAIHAFDFLPWITGLNFSTIHCARSWNAGLPDVPHFKNAAQMMMSLENGCGVTGDVSYFSPDSHGYTLPYYWRTTIWGANGVAETYFGAPGVMVFENGAEPNFMPPEAGNPGGYLQHFIAEISGGQLEDHLTTRGVLRASRVALQAQQAADIRSRDVNCD